jgi:hypothetical protein
VHLHVLCADIQIYCLWAELVLITLDYEFVEVEVLARLNENGERVFEEVFLDFRVLAHELFHYQVLFQIALKFLLYMGMFDLFLAINDVF